MSIPSKNGLVFDHPEELTYNGAECKLNTEGRDADLPLGDSPYTMEAEVFLDESMPGDISGGIIGWGDYG